MQSIARLQSFLSGLVTVVLCTAPVLPRAMAAPPQDARGRGSVNRPDLCALLSNVPGAAHGIPDKLMDKLCPASGQSAGIAKADFNGDGIADLAVGEPGATFSGASGAGDVIVIYGSADGLSTTNVHGPEFWDIHKAVASLGPQAGDSFGAALAAGDFDGDGYSDLAIGIPNRDVKVGLFTHSNAGAVVVLYGSSTGLHTRTSNNYFDANTLDSLHSFQISYDNAHFGQSLAWGNFNGDFATGNHDIGDLVIGIPGAGLVENLGATVYGNGGAVWVIGGSVASGLDTNLNTLVLPYDFSNGLPQDFAGARFGASLAAVNLNAAYSAGRDDLIVGAPGMTVCAPGCVAGAGFFEDVFGLLSSTVTRSNWSPSDINISLMANQHFAASFAVGDFNGDGYPDLAIGIPERTSGGQANAGAVAVFYNAPGVGLTNDPVLLKRQLLDETNFAGTPQSNDHFATALAAGDFNGDGRSDLAIGVPFKAVLVNRGGTQTTLLNAGEVDVMYGSSTGLSTSVRGTQRWTQESALGAGSATSGARFGAPMSAWNFGRNEIVGNFGQIVIKAATDLAVGAPFQSVNGVSGAGAIDVIYGSFNSHGLTSTGSQVWDADAVGLGGLSGAHFGAGIY